WLRFVGKAGHAGAQPMGQRRDALAAAAEFITAVEKDARTTDGLRATVGCLTVSPGAANVVPGEVRLSLDVRHEDDMMRGVAARAMLTAATNAADYRSVEVESEQVVDEPAVRMDAALTGRLAAAAGPGVERLV